ncbi:MAG TPA: hypothetical protein VME41_08990 [Stellaceae bacterium]|nr:hypothetical protein [Stellaceae bacterium]
MIGPAAAKRQCARLMPCLLGLAAAACQPLPHPFADDKPPAALLQVRDTAGVSIAPLVGGPAPVVKKLGDAMAKALLKHDIPASDRTANLDSYQLYGRIIEAPPSDGKASVAAQWSLYDAKGRLVGRRSADVAAAPAEWQSADNAPIDRLADLSADQLAPLLEDKAPAGAPTLPAAGRVRIAIDKIAGAPGDGATALQDAIAAVLQRQDLAITTDGGKADLHIGVDITLSAAASGMQHIKIVWHVRRADGVEIGTVVQQNDIPKGSLDGKWGDVAYNVATAAAGGLMQLVVRGVPPPQSEAQAATAPR